MPSIVPDVKSTFYFGQNFAPIFDPAEYDTPSKRFGFVLSVMRRAKNLTQTEFESSLFPESKRGGSTVSDWETGKTEPSASELRAIFESLGLDVNDRHYMQNLMFGSSDDQELTQEQTEKALADFSIFKNETSKNSQFPAYLIDHYWKILDFNSAAQVFLSIPDHIAEEVRAQKHSLLDIVFEPVFGLARSFGTSEAWEQTALNQIWRFRADTMLLRHQDRYISLVHKLATNKRIGFLQQWYEIPSEEYDPKGDTDLVLTPSPDISLNVMVKVHIIAFVGNRRVTILQWVVKSE